MYGAYTMNSDWFGLKWALHLELMTQGFNSELSSLAMHAWCSKVVSAMVISTHLTILAIIHSSSPSVTVSAIITFAYWSGSSAMMLLVLCSAALLTQYASLSASDPVHP